MANEEPEPSAHGIDRVNREVARRVLNVLLEAPYFYREDDPILFQDLRRSRAAIGDFFKRYFGWDLLIDARCARLVKTERENPALRDMHSDAFRLTRRNQCLVFVLLLEYFEVEARRTQWEGDQDINLRFFYNDFLVYARQRFRELLDERAPEDAPLRNTVQETWELLLRYRFIRFIPPSLSERQEAQTGELYEFLPAIYLYDARVLRDPDWIERLRAAPEEPSGEPPLSDELSN